MSNTNDTNNTYINKTDKYEMFVIKCSKNADLALLSYD